MKVEETYLKGCFVIEPRVFEDNRGYFFESFNKKQFEQAIGKKINFVQDNQSRSIRGVVRGIHYQSGEFAQAKLLCVLHGSVLDVAVDLRKESKTFGQHFSIELSAENKKQLFIPNGFGHGFVTLSETTEIYYKCDNYYNKKAEGGIIYNDKTLNIDWQLLGSEIIVSQKDSQLPSFEDAILKFNYLR